MREIMYVIFYDGQPYMWRNHGDGIYWTRTSAENGLKYFRCRRDPLKWEIKAFALTEIKEGEE